MRRRRHRLQVSTFPFLAVLLCAMGSLILVLLVMDQRAKLAARNRAQEEALKRASQARERARAAREDWERRARELKAAWEKKRAALRSKVDTEEQSLDAELSRVQLQLAEAAVRLHTEEEGVSAAKQKLQEQHIRLSKGEEVLTSLKGVAAKSSALVQAADAARTRLSTELAMLEKTLNDLKATRAKDGQTYSVIPYRGKQGESRRPLYVECCEQGVIFHPDRKQFSMASAADEARTEVVRRITAQRGQTPDIGRRPYLLMLVRPNGVVNYYNLQSVLKDVAIDFGYEFIDDDWVLDFPPEESNPPQVQPWMVSQPSGADPSQSKTTTRITTVHQGGGSPFMPEGTPTTRPQGTARLERPTVGGVGVPGGNGGTSTSAPPPWTVGSGGTGSGPYASGGRGVIGSQNSGGSGTGSDAGGSGNGGSGNGVPGTGVGVNPGSPNSGSGVTAGGGIGYGSGGSGNGGAGVPGGVGSVGGSPNSSSGGPGIGVGYGSGGSPGGVGIGTLPSIGNPGRSPGSGSGPGGVVSGYSPGGSAGGSSGIGTPGSGVSSNPGSTNPGLGASPGGASVGMNPGSPNPGTSGAYRGPSLGYPSAGGTSPGASVATPLTALPGIGGDSGSGRAGGNSGGSVDGSVAGGSGTGNGSGGSGPSLGVAMGTGSGGSGTSMSPDGASGAPGASGAAPGGTNQPPTGSGSIGTPSLLPPLPGAMPPSSSPTTPGIAGFSVGKSTTPPDDASPSPRGLSSGNQPTGSGAGGGGSSAPAGIGPAIAAPEERKTRSRPQPTHWASIGGTRDYVIFVECRRDEVVLYPSQKRFPIDKLSHSPHHNPFLQAVSQMVARRESLNRTLTKPPKTQVRFLLQPDGLQAYHLAFPALDPLTVDKTRQNLQPEDDVLTIVTSN
jgi:hypothetical protein